MKTEQHRQAHTQGYDAAPPPSYDEANSSRTDQLPPPPSYVELQREWQAIKKDERKKEAYEDAARQANQAQNYQTIILARNEACTYYNFRTSYYLDAYDMWLLSRLATTSFRFQCHLATELVKCVPHVFNILGGVSHAAIHVVGNVAQAAAHGVTKVGDDCHPVIIVLAGIAALLALVASAFYGLYYAGKKACKSITNLYQGNKVAKSLVRLAATMAGGIAGAIKCALIGAAIGSSVPIVGTVIGAVVGLCVGAGLGAFIAKHVTRLVYWYKNRNMSNAISKTNPEKYMLSPEREDVLKQNGIKTSAMLTALKIQKNKSDSKTKHAFNSLLEHIKTDKDKKFETLAGKLEIEGQNFFWNRNKGSQGEWEVTPVQAQQQQARL